MSIPVTCAQCHKSFRVKDEYAGRRTKCPGCSAPLVIPQDDFEALPADAIEPMPTVVAPTQIAAPPNGKTAPLVWGMVAVAVGLVLLSGVLALTFIRFSQSPPIAQVEIATSPAIQPIPTPATPVPAQTSVTPPESPAPPAAPQVPTPNVPAPVAPVSTPPEIKLPPGFELPENLPPELRAEALKAMAELARSLPAGLPPAVPSPSDSKDIPYEWRPVVVDALPPPLELPAGHKVEIPLLGASRSQTIVYPTAASPFILAHSSTPDETVFELWDVRTNTRKGAMKLAQSAPRSMVLSPDGALVAFESDKTLQVYSTVSGALISKLAPKDSRGFSHVDFLGDDQLILRQSPSLDLSIWDAMTGQKLSDVPLGGMRSLGPIAYSPDRKYLALVADNALHVKQLQGPLWNRIPLPQVGDRSAARCQWLTFSPDGRELAGLFDASTELTAVCWELTGGKVVAQHKFKTMKGYRTNSTQVPLAWLKAGVGWLAYGSTVIDRQHGGPVWMLPTSTGPGHYPIRPLDANTILAIRTAVDQETIEGITLPADEIAAGLAMIVSGGTLQDVGLPEMTKPDWSKVVDVADLLVPGTWSVAVEPVNLPAFEKAPALELGKSESAVNQIFFGNLTSGAIYAWCRRDYTEPATAKVRTHTLEQYDFKSGKRIGSLQLPFEGDLMAVRGDGKLLAVSPLSNRERIDVVEAATGKHIAGWRPFSVDKDKYGKTVTAATFIGTSYLLVECKSDKFSLWKLPECKAVLTGALGTGGQGIAVSPDQKYLAVHRASGVRLIDVATGQPCGECLVRNDQAAGLASLNLAKSVAFSAKGDRLAFLVQVSDTTKFPPMETTPNYRYIPRSSRYGRSYVLPSIPTPKNYKIPDEAFSGIIGIWNLRTGEKEKEFAIPRSARTMAWSGDDHLLLDGSYLIDLGREMLTWKYTVKHGKIVSDSSDGRTWYTTSHVKGQALLLAAQALPDEAVVRATATAQNVKPTFGSRMPVQLAINLQNTPPEREKLREELATVLKRKLVLNGNEVAESGRTKFLLNIEQRRTNDTIKLRVQGLANAGEVVIPVTEILCNLGIVAESGEVLWSDAQTIKTDEHSDAKPKTAGAEAKSEPESTDIKTLLADRQWAAVVEWLEQIKLPGAIYPSAYREGVGESILTPNGPEAVRTNQVDTPAPFERKT